MVSSDTGKSEVLFSETQNPIFNVHDCCKLIQYCMITSCIPVLIIALHVLLFLCWIPAPVPPPVLLFPPPPANSGSNETSIWPVRKTQTSLPLWEEEPGSCSGKTNGTPDCQKKVNVEKKKNNDGQMMTFPTLELGNVVFSLSLESSISLRRAGLRTRWKDGKTN